MANVARDGVGRPRVSRHSPLELLERARGHVQGSQQQSCDPMEGLQSPSRLAKSLAVPPFAVTRVRPTSVGETAKANVPDGAMGFRAIYEAYFEFVWRILRRFGVRPSDATDLTQKVFLTVHLRLDEFESRAPIRGWLYGICRRAASDYRRSAAIRREVLVDAAELEAEWGDGAGPFTDADSRDTAEIAETVLDRLPEYQRLVFVKFELEEMSGDEISALLNVSVGTVRSRLRLARKAFRREGKRLAIANARTSSV